MPAYTTCLLATQPQDDPAVLEALSFLQSVSKGWTGLSANKPLFRNPIEPPCITDIAFHLDLPIGVWAPWCHANILLLRSSELVVSAAPAIQSYASRFDAVLVKDEETAKAARDAGVESPILWSSASSKQAEIALKEALEKSRAAWRTMPPLLSQAECPPISVITLTYNRRKFIDLAAHNLMITDYPKDKIEWVIIEDSDDMNEQASDVIMKLARGAAPMSVSYIPCEKKKSIGEKRNEAILRAQNDIILMMDDDDHYPETSFRRRVAWLLKHPWSPKAVACSAIACYDLLRGTSYVNIPPFSLSTAQRVSEATLTFHKQWWLDRKFPDEVKVSEGEGFIAGREKDILEIPPQQIIVAMSHNKNASSRRAATGDAKPSCFWGFPKEFLVFLHGLAGVQVEEDTSGGKSESKKKTKNSKS